MGGGGRVGVFYPEIRLYSEVSRDIKIVKEACPDPTAEKEA